MTEQIIETLEQESQDLALHVDLCARRYQQITERMDRIDAKIDSITEIMSEIRDTIRVDQRDNYKMYLGWATAALTTGATIASAAIVHFLK